MPEFLSESGWKEAWNGFSRETDHREWRRDWRYRRGRVLEPELALSRGLECHPHFLGKNVPSSSLC